MPVDTFKALAANNANIQRMIDAGLTGWQRQRGQRHDWGYSDIYTLKLDDATLEVVQRMSADRSYSVSVIQPVNPAEEAKKMTKIIDRVLVKEGLIKSRDTVVASDSAQTRFVIRPLHFVQAAADDQVVEELGPISRDVRDTGEKVQHTLDSCSFSDYFRDDDILRRVYPTRDTAQKAAEAAYTGLDEFGVGVGWEIEAVEIDDDEDENEPVNPA